MTTARPVPTSTVVWQPRPGVQAVTVVAKLTYDLAPGVLTLSAAQEPLFEADTYWDDDPRRSLTTASDLAPRKSRVDVVLVGSAFATGGRPTTTLVARLDVGAMSKSIEVHGDRALSPHGEPGPASPFARMRLTYERTLGGPTTWNPAGVAASSRARALPNLVPVGTPAQQAGSTPIGFGPIARQWVQRKEGDPAFYNVAPPDQQLERLAEDATLRLENLHPTHPVLVASLPAHRPRASVQLPSGARRVALEPDTLWIDTDRALCTVTWRGHVEVTDAPRAPVAHVELDATPAPPRPSGTVPGLPPDDDDDDPGRGARTMIGSLSSIRAALPFVAAAHGAPSPPRAPLETVPFITPSSAPPPVQAPPPSSPGVHPLVSPAPYSAPYAPPPPAPAPRASEPGAYAMPSYALGAPPSAPSHVPVPAMAHASTAALAGVMGASHAAADPSRHAPSAPSLADYSGTIIDLVWFMPEAAERVRKNPAWRAILEEAAKRPRESGARSSGIADEPAEGEDRQEIFELLARATPSSEVDIENALADAVRPDGRFAPRLVILSGELRFDFDPVEALRATAASAAPFTSTDAQLKEAVDAGNRFLAQAGMIPAPGIADRLTSNIRDAYAKTTTLVGPAFVDDQSERALLERRAFERRDVFGAKHLRALYFQLGSTNGVPTYLPDALAKELPLFRRLRARLLVEVHFQADQYETHRAALRAAAFARVVRST